MCGMFLIKIMMNVLLVFIIQMLTGHIHILDIICFVTHNAQRMSKDKTVVVKVTL